MGRWGVSCLGEQGQQRDSGRGGTGRGFTALAALCRAQRGLPGPGGATAVALSLTAQGGRAHSPGWPFPRGNGAQGLSAECKEPERGPLTTNEVI